MVWLCGHGVSHGHVHSDRCVAGLGAGTVTADGDGFSLGVVTTGVTCVQHRECAQRDPPVRFKMVKFTFREFSFDKIVCVEAVAELC